MLKNGEILDNKYCIIKQLGKGGTGHVYLAENIKIGNTWAVKEVDITKVLRGNILAEVEILKKVNHRSIPRIIDVIENDNFLYIIEDYFEGTNLKELIWQRQACTEQEIIKWFNQLGDILFHLHNIKPNPIIYRDMKPSNVIIDQENNAKLVDLGIAREYKKGQDSDTAYIGTRGYAAPEQYSGVIQTDERTDIYGLGVTMYHAITGVNPNLPPYKLMPVRRIKNSLSYHIERIIQRCTQTDPLLRYQSVQQLLDDLNNNSNACISISSDVNPANKTLSSKLIIIGSLSPRAGSSFVTVNLAAAASELGQETAIIEFPANIPYLYDALFMRNKIPGSYVSWPHEIKRGNLFNRKHIFKENNINWIVLDPVQHSILDWTLDNMIYLIYCIKQIPFVFLDVSTNWLHPSLNSLLGQADHMFLVLDPDPALIDRTTLDYDETIPMDCLPQETKIVQLLADLKFNDLVDIQVIVNKYTGLPDENQLCLPFSPLAFIPHIDPSFVYKSLWDGQLLYHDTQMKELLGPKFSPILKKVTSLDKTSIQPDKVGLIERIKAAYKSLKGEGGVIF